MCWWIKWANETLPPENILVIRVVTGGFPGIRLWCGRLALPARLGPPPAPSLGKTSKQKQTLGAWCSPVLIGLLLGSQGEMGGQAKPS